jgi:cobyrinic acid a,c-diamide synthase
MTNQYSNFCIAGAGSGVGKTTVTLGILAALNRRGLSIAPFKCGPDYIDPAFHKAASGEVSRNLDLWMMGNENVCNTFYRHSESADVAVVEGVMGLFDGVGPGNEGSTAKIAKKLNLPVLLVVNARGIAGTIAPLVKGFTDFENGVEIAGIIANNVGSANHAKLLDDALNHSNLPPLLGYLPRDSDFAIPERHLGLISATETANGTEGASIYNKLAESVERSFKIDEILEICEVRREPFYAPLSGSPTFSSKKRVAVAIDRAFHFYYEDNLDLLRNNGVEIVPFSPINDAHLPGNIDWIYIGGGFPESFAAELSANISIKSDIANFAENEGFIYAECGGLMYLSESITDHNGDTFDMCGVIPVRTSMDKKMRSLGYREVRTISDSPLAKSGTIYRGHEFHWSSVSEIEMSDPKCTHFCEVRNARGGEWQKAGFRYKNVMASYIHAYFSKKMFAESSHIHINVK